MAKRSVIAVTLICCGDAERSEVSFSTCGFCLGPPRSSHRSCQRPDAVAVAVHAGTADELLVTLCRQLRLSPLARTPHKNGKPEAVDINGNGHAVSAYELMRLSDDTQ